MDLVELQRRADSGSCVAQTILGVYLLDGIGTETNPEAAHHYLHAAALQGGSRAMVNLGRMYFEGIGVPKDVHESIRWYESAASAGEFLAQIALGRIYSHGLGITRDSAAARKWFSAAIKQQSLVQGCDDEIAEAKRYIAAADLET